MRIVYFAAVRELVGLDGEDCDLPEHALTITDILDWLSKQGAQYETAFGNRAKLRFALDQQMAKPGSAIAGAHELAIFPPVTGG